MPGTLTASKSFPPPDVLALYAATGKSSKFAIARPFLTCCSASVSFSNRNTLSCLPAVLHFAICGVITSVSCDRALSARRPCCRRGRRASGCPSGCPSARRSTCRGEVVDEVGAVRPPFGGVVHRRHDQVEASGLQRADDSREVGVVDELHGDAELRGHRLREVVVDALHLGGAFLEELDRRVLDVGAERSCLLAWIALGNFENRSPPAVVVLLLPELLLLLLPHAASPTARVTAATRVAHLRTFVPPGRGRRHTTARAPARESRPLPSRRRWPGHAPHRGSRSTARAPPP